MLPTEKPRPLADDLVLLVIDFSAALFLFGIAWLLFAILGG